MVEAARAEGVPFAEWDSTDIALKLTSAATPSQLANLVKLDAAWVDAGVSLDLTRQLPDNFYRQLALNTCTADTGLVNYPRILGGDDVRRIMSNQEGGH